MSTASGRVTPLGGAYREGWARILARLAAAIGGQH